MNQVNVSPSRYQTVMVVDDNEIDRYIAEGVIIKNRFAGKVIIAESAADALSFIEAHADKPGELPQVIFLDINMPEMNGFEFLDRYEKLPEQVKKNCIIMMLTTSLDENDRRSASENKYVSMFLNKPLNKEKLETVK
ncbi:MAG TPA: response regulator [Flavipsychrobacter sp.]|nr:response regulator [Flavipsychrobacter sp.]